MSNPRHENGRFIRIDEIYACISIDKEGLEGIVCATFPDGATFPLLTADAKNVESLRQIADDVSKTQGFQYEIRTYKREG